MNEIRAWVDELAAWGSASEPEPEEGSPIDHSECVPAPWSHRTHNHEGVAGAWLFPSEVPGRGGRQAREARQERTGAWMTRSVPPPCGYYDPGPGGIVVQDPHDAAEGPLYFFVPVGGGAAVRVAVCRKHAATLAAKFGDRP